MFYQKAFLDSHSKEYSINFSFTLAPGISRSNLALLSSLVKMDKLSYHQIIM